MTQAARSSSVLERDQVEDGTAVGFDPPNAEIRCLSDA